MNIKLGAPVRLHAIAGRLIDAETGHVVPNGSFIFGTLGEGSRGIIRGEAYHSDDKGEFRIEGVMSGRYTAFARPDVQSRFYSEPVEIVVSEEDVRGVEISREFGLEGFTLLRVERDGVERWTDLAPNEQVTDVRLVFAYGAETVSGQIRVEGGALPEGAYIRIASRRIRSDGGRRNPPVNARATADARGHFKLVGMSVGDHELTISVDHMPIPPTRHLINVAKGKENNVILTLNLDAKADRR